MSVVLIGAGPGDPGLITTKGAELLKRADVVIYDRLVDPALLSLAPPTAELIDVGKKAGSGKVKQEDINELLCSYAGKAEATGGLVVRLKGGDPFVFGRGGEEIEALAARGLICEVVPGVTSAFGVPAALGIPVTHRGLSTSVTVVTGRVGPTSGSKELNWESFAHLEGTLVILMGMATRKEIAHRLMKAGKPPTTPIAVIEWGTTGEQRFVTSTLSQLASVELESPSVIVIGPVAGLSLNVLFPSAVPNPIGEEKEKTPQNLSGISVVVTRPTESSGPFVKALQQHGAHVVQMPVTQIRSSQNELAAGNDAGSRVQEFAWIVFTSANGARRFFECVPDHRGLSGVKIAAVGSATTKALRTRGFIADLVPGDKETRSATGLGSIFPLAKGEGNQRVLFPCAKGASRVLQDELCEKGWDVERVELYRAEVCDLPFHDGVIAAARRAQVVTFASPSSVTAYLQRCGLPLPSQKVVCLGPSTGEFAKGRGLQVAAIAKRADSSSLLDAICDLGM